jgi:hypothetical protein
MRKADLLAQIDMLHQLLTTQGAEQRALIAQLHERVERAERGAQELELRVQQRVAALERAYADELALLTGARERRQGVVAQLRGTIDVHRRQLEEIEAQLDLA